MAYSCLKTLLVSLITFQIGISPVLWAQSNPATHSTSPSAGRKPFGTSKSTIHKKTLITDTGSTKETVHTYVEVEKNYMTPVEFFDAYPKMVDTLIEATQDLKSCKEIVYTYPLGSGLGTTAGAFVGTIAGTILGSINDAFKDPKAIKKPLMYMLGGLAVGAFLGYGVGSAIDIRNELRYGDDFAPLLYGSHISDTQIKDMLMRQIPSGDLSDAFRTLAGELLKTDCKDDGGWSPEALSARESLKTIRDAQYTRK